MKRETLKEQAERIKRETAYEETRCSEDYPLGGTIEPYDIIREQEHLEGLEKEPPEKK